MTNTRDGRDIVERLRALSNSIGDEAADIIEVHRNSIDALVAGWNNDRAELTRLRCAASDAQFLLDRLSEVEIGGSYTDLMRDWYGHVEPAISRLRTALSASPQPPPAGEEYWKTKQGAAFNAISELCNPDASLSERMEAATSLRAAFGWPVEHADGCAIHEVDEPDGSECDCEYWDDSPPSAAIRSLAHGDSNDR